MATRQAGGDEDIGGRVKDVDEGGLRDHGGEDVAPVVYLLRHQGEEEGRREGEYGRGDEEDAAWDQVQNNPRKRGEDYARDTPRNVPKSSVEGGYFKDELDAKKGCVSSDSLRQERGIWRTD